MQTNKTAARKIALHFLEKGFTVALECGEKDYEDIYVVSCRNTKNRTYVFIISGLYDKTYAAAARKYENAFYILNCNGIIHDAKEPHTFRKFLSPLRQAKHFAKHGHSKPIDGLLCLGTDY